MVFRFAAEAADGDEALCRWREQRVEVVPFLARPADHGDQGCGRIPRHASFAGDSGGVVEFGVNLGQASTHGVPVTSNCANHVELLAP
jgi:hypothetical protein